MLVPPPQAAPQRRIGRHETRAHALFQPAPGALRHAQQLDGVSHVGGLMDVLDGDLADPFQLDTLEIHLCAKGNCTEQRQLVPGINPTHIKVGSASR